MTKRSSSEAADPPPPSRDGETPATPLRGVVIMPMAWRGGMLKVASQLCNLLARHTYQGRSIQMCLAGNEHTARAHFDLDAGVSFVNVALEPVFSADPRLSRYLDPAVYPFTPTEPNRFVSPNSANVALFSADFWISLTGFYNEGPLAPFKPYAVFAPDFIQRYVPEILPDDINNYGWYREACQIMTMQAAKVVFATTPKTVSDVTTYAGVPRDRVLLFPLFNSHEGGRLRKSSVDRTPKVASAPATSEAVDADSMDHQWKLDRLLKYRYAFSPDFIKSPYFVWVTNTTEHKNHLRAIEMLASYYERHDGALNCLIVGPSTDKWADNDSEFAYIRDVADGIAGLASRTNKVHLLGELPSSLYADVLSGAQFLWHNVLYDNGTFTVLEAAELGIPSLSSDYPQIRYICELYGVQADFFDAHDAAEGARALKQMEERQKAGPIDPGFQDLKPDLREAFDSLLDRILAPSAFQPVKA